MTRLLKALGLAIGLSVPLMAAPVSPPAGNFIVNVSTLVSKQVFSVSSGTVKGCLYFGDGTSLCTASGGGGGGVGGAFAAWYLVDANNVKWSVKNDTSGHEVTAVVSSIPTGALAPHQLVTQDSSFNLWKITIDITGHLITTLAGTTAQSITDLLMNDSANITWVNTVDTGGHLVTQ